MFSGKKEPSKIRSGGNVERENFKAKVAAMPRGQSEGESKPPAGGGGETSIMHHPDGTHEVTHHDGEKTTHPNMGHMLMTLHAKHSPDEGHHIESHADGSHTSHHADMAGMVSGPHEHPDGGALMDHMGGMIGAEKAEGMGPIDTGSGEGGNDESSLY